MVMRVFRDVAYHDCSIIYLIFYSSATEVPSLLPSCSVSMGVCFSVGHIARVRMGQLRFGTTRYWYVCCYFLHRLFPIQEYRK